MRNARIERRRAKFARILQRQIRREREQISRPHDGEADDQDQPVNAPEERGYFHGRRRGRRFVG